MQRYKKFLSVYSIRVPPRVTQEPEKRKPNFFCQSIKKRGWCTRIFLAFSMGLARLLHVHAYTHAYPRSLARYTQARTLTQTRVCTHACLHYRKWIVFERWLKTSLNLLTAHRPYKRTAHRKIYTFIFILCRISNKVYYICLSNEDITSSSK